METGLRQGSPQAALLFNAVISNVLGKLVESWKARGMGTQLSSFEGDPGCFKKWLSKHACHVNGFDIENLHISALAFADDIYLLARSAIEAAVMLSEVREELSKIGL